MKTIFVLESIIHKTLLQINYNSTLTILREKIMNRSFIPDHTKLFREPVRIEYVNLQMIGPIEN